MKKDTSELLQNIMGILSGNDFINSADVPNIDLYMDQVTSFMEDQLKSSKRYDEDKVLTKTMINNYAKSELLPAPVKKKYSKEHLLLLTFIYYFKNILTMKDIELLLKPITEKYFQADSKVTITSIYDEVCTFEKEHANLIQKDVELMFHRSLERFSSVDSEEQQSLQLFAFMCSLIFDIYAKKSLLEKLIDECFTPEVEKPEKEKEKEKKKKEK